MNSKNELRKLLPKSLLTESQFALLTNLRFNKISAIKFVKDYSAKQLSLKECKQFVEIWL